MAWANMPVDEELLGAPEDQDQDVIFDPAFSEDDAEPVRPEVYQARTALVTRPVPPLNAGEDWRLWRVVAVSDENARRAMASNADCVELQAQELKFGLQADPTLCVAAQAGEEVCVACTDHRVTRVCRPCMHPSYCEHCAVTVVGGINEERFGPMVPKTCPLCRALLGSLEKVPGGVLVQ